MLMTRAVDQPKPDGFIAEPFIYTWEKQRKRFILRHGSGFSVEPRLDTRREAHGANNRPSLPVKMSLTCKSAG
jgi:hypothetical protein